MERGIHLHLLHYTSLLKLPESKQKLQLPREETLREEEKPQILIHLRPSSSFMFFQLSSTRNLTPNAQSPDASNTTLKVEDEDETRAKTLATNLGFVVLVDAGCCSC